jgi:hypothetical protein
MTVGMEYVGAPFDRAVSAFIEDVEARGLGDKILLVCCGEMGRTPSINKNGGRDHWGNLAPLLLYGGGLKMGRVIGESSRDGGQPASEAVTMKDLLATIMHTLLDITRSPLMPGIPRAGGRGHDARRTIGGWFEFWITRAMQTRLPSPPRCAAKRIPVSG